MPVPTDGWDGWTMTQYLLGLATIPALAGFLYGLVWIFETDGVAVCRFDKKEITIWRRLPGWNHSLHFWRHHREYVRASTRLARRIKRSNPDWDARDVTRAVVAQMKVECPELLPPAPAPFRIPTPGHGGV